MNVLTVGGGFISDHLPYPRFSSKLENKQHIQNMLDEKKTDILINCIGKTGVPNIDWCEEHQAETAFANTILPIMLADECDKRSIRMIHIGSGCIFFGYSPRAINDYHLYFGQPNSVVTIDSGWKETDFANPQYFYTKTKYACDLVLGSMKNVTTLRIRMPISSRVHPRNLIDKIRQYKQITDIQNSVTFIDDLVRCIDWFIDNEGCGIFHATNPGTISIADIMKEYQKYVPEHKFEIVSESCLGGMTLAKRSNCIIDSHKLEAFAKIQMKPAKEALAECMAKYAKNLK